MMKVKIKKLSENAVVPKYAHDTDAGLDLVATSKKVEDGCIVYGTGLAFEIPEGFVGLIFPRSSLAKKHLTLTNSVGVIDSGYRGEVTFKFRPSMDIRDYDGEKVTWNTSMGVINTFTDYNVGDRIGQLIILPYPKIEFEEADELSKSERGEGGYGSTGK